MTESLPRIPGVNDLASMIAFLGNRKEYEKYFKQLVDQYTRIQDAIAVYGKAQDIEKLHAEAMDLKNSVLVEIERREAGLVAGKEAFAREQETTRREIAEEQRIASEEAHKTRSKADQMANNARAMEDAARAANEDANKALEQAAADRDAIAALRAELEEQVAVGRKLMKGNAA